MKDYTVVRNQILGPSQLSVSSRYLYLLLLKHCGQDDYCYPSQKTLGNEMGMSDRNIRKLLNELISAEIITKRRKGWNKSNTYKVAKILKIMRNGISYHLGTVVPIQSVHDVPTKSTYIKVKGKRSLKGMENLRQAMYKKGIIK